MIRENKNREVVGFPLGGVILCAEVAQFRIMNY